MFTINKRLKNNKMGLSVCRLCTKIRNILDSLCSILIIKNYNFKPVLICKLKNIHILWIFLTINSCMVKVESKQLLFFCNSGNIWFISRQVLTCLLCWCVFSKSQKTAKILKITIESYVDHKLYLGQLRCFVL